MTAITCPLCRATDAILSVHRDAIPVLQNVVYPTAAAARAAPQGRFDLATCTSCGFSWNAGFDPAAITYDETYDNHVASPVFDAYYADLAQMLIDRFGITDGTIYDIGCGKGEFLRIFARLAPNVRCIGIDPSCTPVNEGNFELRRTRFERSVFDGQAQLVLLRHVLEHIDTPRDFLASLRQSIPDAPIFVEVPDLDWILSAEAFWDFCYEHCNYFTLQSLAAMLGAAGFTLVEQRRSFGNQYQWAIATPGDAVAPAGGLGKAAVAALQTYVAGESRALDHLRARAEVGIAIWGMATKGVLLATLLGAELVIAGIDMNRRKQGHHAAGSGTLIRGPEALAELPAGVTVVVMNPNYLAEISATIASVRRDLAIATAGQAEVALGRRLA